MRANVPLHATIPFGVLLLLYVVETAGSIVLECVDPLLDWSNKT